MGGVWRQMEEDIQDNADNIVWERKPLYCIKVPGESPWVAPPSVPRPPTPTLHPGAPSSPLSHLCGALLLLSTSHSVPCHLALPRCAHARTQSHRHASASADAGKQRGTERLNKQQIGVHSSIWFGKSTWVSFQIWKEERLTHIH